LEVDPQVSLSALHTTAIGLLRYGINSRPDSRTGSNPPWLRLVERTRQVLEEYF